MNYYKVTTNNSRNGKDFFFYYTDSADNAAERVLEVESFPRGTRTTVIGVEVLSDAEFDAI
jgi:hypothetical protein